MDVIDQILLYAAIILVLVAIGVGLFVFLQMKQYKYKVQIRRMLNGTKLIENDSAKDYIDEAGNKFLRRLKAKKHERLLPVPPSKAISPDTKGNMHGIVNLGEDGSYVWLTDDTDDSTLVALNSNQRMSLVHQLRKANERKRQNWKDYIPMIANGVVILLIMVCFMIFFGEVVAPAQELGSAVKEAGIYFKEAAEKYEQIDSNIQQLLDEKVVDDSDAIPPS